MPLLTEAHYEMALNYFYYLLMDESVAINCALKALQLYAKNNKSNIAGENVDEALIQVLSKVLHKRIKKKWLASGAPAKSEWKPPNSEVLAQWKEYLRHSDFDASETLVLRYVLGFPAKSIARALELPEGTIYFRISRGLEVFAGSKA